MDIFRALGGRTQIAIEAFCEQDEGLGYPVLAMHPLRERRAETSSHANPAGCFAERPRLATFRRNDAGK
jgi:hypothetical protein